MAYEKLKLEFYDNIGGLNQKASEYITGPNQLLDVRNFGYERPGALTSRPGQEVWASLPMSQYLAKPAGLYAYGNLKGTTQIVFDSGPTLFVLGGAAFASSMTPNATTALAIDFETVNYNLFAANGFGFQVYNQTFTSYFSTPMFAGFYSGTILGNQVAGATYNLSLIGSAQTLIVASGTYAFQIAYQKGNEDVFTENVGEIVPSGATHVLRPEVFAFVSSTIVAATGLWRVYGFTVPEGYNISLVVPYVRLPGSSAYIAGEKQRVFFGIVQFGGTLFNSITYEHFTIETAQNVVPHFTLVPKFLESYKNMLFMAGFSSQPSTVWFSEIADPENVQDENFFEVRTSNGDEITCLKVFQDTLIAFKRKSIHEINGDSPDALSLKDMTLEYGCVNNEAAVTFENKLWFVDEKGICEYSGPNTSIVSTPVEDTFLTLDVSKAKAFHVKKRNEVWFNFGGTSLIYNYQNKVWSIYDNIENESGVGAAVLDFSSTRSDFTYLRQGSSHYNLARFGDSLTTDFGQAISLMIKTPYFKRADTVQEMWRRMYVDATAGSTVGATALFRQDYGSSVVLTRSVSLGVFEQRIDFGISARSLSVELLIRSASQVTINGYALEARYLRNV